MPQDQPRLTHSIKQYQHTAKELNAELIKAFNKFSKKTGTKPLKPLLNSLQSKHDVPKLDDIIKEIYENVEKLRGLDRKEEEKKKKSKHPWDKFKDGISKFVKCTFPALTSFLTATKDAQSVSCPPQKKIWG
jgi:hypothetical protein